MSGFPEALDIAIYQITVRAATDRVIEFLTDPEMDGVRAWVRRGGHGLDAGQACRAAVLSQVGTLGEPGPRLGLLVYSLEVLLNLVRWGQVAEALKLGQPERSPYLARALEGVDLPRYDPS